MSKDPVERVLIVVVVVIILILALICLAGDQGVETQSTPNFRQEQEWVFTPTDRV